MKLKCRINEVDYDVNLVQGCTFTENFNETLDSGIIYIDHINEIENLKPYDDVFIWNANEEFNGYYCKGDFLFIRTTVDIETSGDLTQIASYSNFYDNGQLITIPYIDKAFFGSNLDTSSYIFSIGGIALDLWFDRFLNYTEETKSNFRYALSNDTLLMNSFDLRFEIEFTNMTDGQQYTDFAVLKAEPDFYNGINKVKLVLEDQNQLFGDEVISISCIPNISTNIIDFSANKQTYIEGISKIRITSIRLDPNGALYFKNKLSRSIDLTLDYNDLSSINNFNFSVKYFGNWLRGTATLASISTNVNTGEKIYNVNFTIWLQGGMALSTTVSFEERDGIMLVGNIDNDDYETLNFWNLVDDVQIDDLSVVSKDYSHLPSFFKHLLVDSFSKQRLQVGDSYGDKNVLYRYQINLFSETKRLEKIPLPNISITQSIVVEEKRSCWFYLEKFVDLYSPKYKKSNNVAEKTWEYVSKYYVGQSSNEYLQSWNPHIVTNLKEVFENVICPEFSLTNPSLKDVISQIMITKDLIPIVFNDVIYGLDIGATNYEAFDRNGTNFDESSLNSDNYATDARREYDNALSQENSAHLVEYLGFRNPDSAFLTLEGLTLETRFPIYKINSIKMCYYKKFTLTKRGTENDETPTTIKRIFLCKYDITPLVLQNVVRNTLSTRWDTFEAGSSEDPLNALGSPEEKIKFAAQYKLCTVGYDIGSNKIAGWGTTYEHLDFLWFKASKSYIENIVWLMESISPVGTEVFQSYLETLNGKNQNPQDYSMSVDTQGTGLDAIESFGESNLPNKIKSIVFEIDYDAMYNGAIIHSKDYIDDDDIVTVDNCSAALTLLEADGLFEKEKMNRMSNPIFKIPARYDNDNGGATVDRVQKLATYDEETDSIIYSREYQIFENVIFADYESTREYVLKNYFTSVWAKYRTYSLMSYGESVKRAENFKELVILSKQSLYYEKEGLFANNPQIENKLLSFLKPTDINEIGVITNKDKINCGYFTIDSKKYLSDINSFASGKSVCFNIVMYDNVSAGTYVKSLSANMPGFIVDPNWSVDQIADMKATQEWYRMVTSISDAFVENIGIYVCNLDNVAFWGDDVITQATFNSNKSKFLALPYVSQNIASYQNNLIGKTFTLNKDNKEKIDATFQFDYVAQLQDKDDILISSWVSKLNDMVGVYTKFDTDKELTSKISLGDAVQVFIKSKGYANPGDEGAHTTADVQAVIKITEAELIALKNAIDNNLNPKFYSATFVNQMSYYEGVSAGFTLLSLDGTSSNVQFNNITGVSGIDVAHLENIDSNAKISVNGNYTFNYHYRAMFLFWDTENRDFSSGTQSFNSDFYYLTKKVEQNEQHEDIIYYYFMAILPRSMFYYDYQGKFWDYWRTRFTGIINADNASSLSSENTCYVASYINVASTEFDVVDNTNMMLIVSTEKLKPNLVYNSFKVNSNGQVSLPNGMYSDTKGLNAVSSGHTVPQVFTLGDNFISVNASLYNSYNKNIKSIQYYYKDDEGWLHFVFGINVERNASNQYDDFNVYVSCVSKRNMKVYNDRHRLIGYARNYVDELYSQSFGVKQYYVLGKLLDPIVDVPENQSTYNFVINITNNNSGSERLTLNAGDDSIGVINIPHGSFSLIVNPTRELKPNEINVTDILRTYVASWVYQQLTVNVSCFFIDNNQEYTNSNEVIILNKNHN